MTDPANQSSTHRGRTPLTKLVRDGSTLKSPWDKLAPMMEFQSWRDDRLPAMLWAVLVRSQTDQPTAIDCFRNVSLWWRKFDFPKEVDTASSHVSLVNLEESQKFDFINTVVKSLPSAEILRPLLLITNLPDYQAWKLCIPETPILSDWRVLQAAIYDSYDHQSQSATDIRWLRVMSHLYAGRLKLGNQEEVEKYEKYPEFGDQRAVRPSIRATEGALSQMLTHSEKPWAAEFWAFVWNKTKVIPAELEDNTEELPDGQAIDRLRLLLNHMREQYTLSKTSAFSPKHESSFGLTISAIQIALEVSEKTLHQSVLGLYGLRQVLESYIYLAFLAQKSDYDWGRYAEYGYGQAKLISLKWEKIPESERLFDGKAIELFANEEKWEEFRDIELKSWTKHNLRQLSEYGNTKDLYDKHYDIISSIVHANWLGVAFTAYQYDANPLHRFCKVPREKPIRFRSILPASLDMAERMVEITLNLFPACKKPGSDPAMPS